MWLSAKYCVVCRYVRYGLELYPTPNISFIDIRLRVGGRGRPPLQNVVYISFGCRGVPYVGARYNSVLIIFFFVFVQTLDIQNRGTEHNSRVRVLQAARYLIDNL